MLQRRPLRLSTRLAIDAKRKGKPSDSVLEALSRIVATVQTVEKLAERVEKLENRPELQHAGTWKESKSYQSGISARIIPQ